MAAGPRPKRVIRPSLKAQEETALAKEATPAPVVKRGRGRPRKVVPPAADEVSHRA